MKSLITTENQLNVQIAEGVSIIGSSLRISEGAEYEAVQKAFFTLMAMDRVSQWCLGDLINASEAQFGEKYSQMLEASGLQYATLMVYASMARSYMPEDRRNLSFDHHRIVQKYEREKRQYYLQTAIDNNMRVGEFRQYIRQCEGKPAKKSGEERKMKYVASVRSVPFQRGDLWDMLADESSIELDEVKLALMGVPLPKTVDSVIVIGVRYADEVSMDEKQKQASEDLGESGEEVPFG